MGHNFLMSWDTQNPGEGRTLFIIIHMFWAAIKALIKCYENRGEGAT